MNWEVFWVAFVVAFVVCGGLPALLFVLWDLIPKPWEF